jgi:hypothetical protein
VSLEHELTPRAHVCAVSSPWNSSVGGTGRGHCRGRPDGMSGPPTPQVVARPPPADRVDDSVALDIRTTLAPAGKWMSVDGIDAALLRMCAVSTGATVDSAGRLPVLVNPTNRAPRTARAFMVTFYHFLTVNRYSHAAVRRHTRQRGRNAVFPRGCNLFRDMELVFIPRNVGNAPWTLVVISTTVPGQCPTSTRSGRRRVWPGRAYATWRATSRTSWRRCRATGVIAEDEQYRAYRTEITADVPQQPNQTDCGAYVLAFAHALLLKKPLTSIKADHIDYYRARWASCLLGQTAASHN